MDTQELATNAFLNFTSARRGNLIIGFINNTDARAIFTFGGYDPLDENTIPDFAQLRLDPGSTSSQITQPCRRIFSVGGPDLIRLVDERGDQIADPPALVRGVIFSTAPVTDPLGSLPTEGTAEPLELELGVDYQCAGLLLLTFEEDASVAGGFRIDVLFVPEE